MKKCGESNGICILKEYFCDKRFNCPQSSSSHQYITNDETDCNYDTLGFEDTTLSPDSDSNETGFGISFGNLNLISFLILPLDLQLDFVGLSCKAMF